MDTHSLGWFQARNQAEAAALRVCLNSPPAAKGCLSRLASSVLIMSSCLETPAPMMALFSCALRIKYGLHGVATQENSTARHVMLRH